MSPLTYSLYNLAQYMDLSPAPGFHWDCHHPNLYKSSITCNLNELALEPLFNRKLYRYRAYWPFVTAG